jgi:hypothetical protein
MGALAVIECFDVIEDLGSSLGASVKTTAVNQFQFEGAPKAFHGGIVVTVAAATHRSEEAGLAEGLAVRHYRRPERHAGNPQGKEPTAIPFTGSVVESLHCRLRNQRSNIISQKITIMPPYEDFPIISVCRADLESIGFDTATVDDATMKELAERLADDYCDQLFWSSIEIIAEFLEIPKRVPSENCDPASH